MNKVYEFIQARMKIGHSYVGVLCMLFCDSLKVL